MVEALGAYRAERESADLVTRLPEAKQLDAVLDLVGNSTIMSSLDMLKRGGKACLAGWLGGLAAWPEAAGQRAALAAFYDHLQRQIDSGLNASVRSTGAYKKAAKAILSTLGTAPAIDTGARTLAAQTGVDLVPVTFPEALR